MKKYVIERPIPGVGSLTRDALHFESTRSCCALEELGPDIQWVHSYVTDDKIYCVYQAESEALIREHGTKGGFPVSRISRVRNMIEPATAEMETA